MDQNSNSQRDNPFQSLASLAASLTRRGDRLTGLSSGQTQLLVGRVMRQLERSQVWVPDVGSLSPRMVERFSGEIVQRYPDLVKKYLVEPAAEQAEGQSETEELVLAPGGMSAPAVWQPEPEAAAAPTRAGGQPPDLAKPPAAARPAPPSVVIRAAEPVQRRPDVRPISRVEEIVPEASRGPAAEAAPESIPTPASRPDLPPSRLQRKTGAPEPASSRVVPPEQVIKPAVENIEPVRRRVDRALPRIMELPGQPQPVEPKGSAERISAEGDDSEVFSTALPPEKIYPEVEEPPSFVEPPGDPAEISPRAFPTGPQIGASQPSVADPPSHLADLPTRPGKKPLQRKVEPPSLPSGTGLTSPPTLKITPPADLQAKADTAPQQNLPAEPARPAVHGEPERESTVPVAPGKSPPEGSAPMGQLVDQPQPAEISRKAAPLPVDVPALQDLSEEAPEGPVRETPAQKTMRESLSPPPSQGLPTPAQRKEQDSPTVDRPATAEHLAVQRATIPPAPGESAQTIGPTAHPIPPEQDYSLVPSKGPETFASIVETAQETPGQSPLPAGIPENLLRKPLQALPPAGQVEAPLARPGPSEGSQSTPAPAQLQRASVEPTGAEPTLPVAPRSQSEPPGTETQIPQTAHIQREPTGEPIPLPLAPVGRELPYVSEAPVEIPAELEMRPITQTRSSDLPQSESNAPSEAAPSREEGRSQPAASEAEWAYPDTGAALTPPVQKQPDAAQAPVKPETDRVDHLSARVEAASGPTENLQPESSIPGNEPSTLPVQRQSESPLSLSRKAEASVLPTAQPHTLEIPSMQIVRPVADTETEADLATPKQVGSMPADEMPARARELPGEVETLKRVFEPTSATAPVEKHELSPAPEQPLEEVATPLQPTVQRKAAASQSVDLPGQALLARAAARAQLPLSSPPAPVQRQAVSHPLAPRKNSQTPSKSAVLVQREERRAASLFLPLESPAVLPQARFELSADLAQSPALENGSGAAVEHNAIHPYPQAIRPIMPVQRLPLVLRSAEPALPNEMDADIEKMPGAGEPWSGSLTAEQIQRVLEKGADHLPPVQPANGRVQRAAADTEPAAAQMEEEQELDLDKLAREVYPLIKRMLAVERERFKGR